MTSHDDARGQLQRVADDIERIRQDLDAALARRYDTVDTAQARFGTALNELTVRRASDEQPILDVLMAIFAMIQRPQPGIEVMVGEAMSVLTLWARGDVETAAVINEVEQRAGGTFSKDRRAGSPHFVGCAHVGQDHPQALHLSPGQRVSGYS